MRRRVIFPFLYALAFSALLSCKPAHHGLDLDRLENDADVLFVKYPERVGNLSETPEATDYLRSLKISRLYVGEHSLSFTLKKSLTYSAQIVVARKGVNTSGMNSEHLALSSRVFRLRSQE